MNSNDWQFWIDRGGTFTDIVALRPDGALQTAKLLSDKPEQYSDAAAEGVRRLLAAWQADGQPTARIAAIKMGTTVATNALLERRGARSALLVTAGFEDALEIGYQNRPDIFALEIVKPAPLYEQVAGVHERLAADGTVVLQLDEGHAKEQLRQIYASGVRSLAICLLHGYRYPQHERRLAELAAAAGFKQVSVSSEVEPLIRFVSRAQTTLADAYLTPVLQSYIENLQSELRAVGEPDRLLFMQSSGGLADAAHFRGKDSVLSGPAGGVVGMAESARAAGLQRLVGFDMGGTSTDVSAWSGEYERSNDSEIAGIRLRAPMLKIHTIAAGGGSLLRYRDGRFQVGPESAGATPGPLSYRNDGPLTITDANVVLGRIPVTHFPKVFGPAGDQPLDANAAIDAFVALAHDISQSATPMSTEEVAAGFLTVAIESMANAIRKITIERGEDVRDFTLCCFGGAGGQHACGIAEVLGMQRIWLHPLAGVLSAYGMGLADLRAERQLSIDAPLTEHTLENTRTTAEVLQRECAAELAEQQVTAERCHFTLQCGLRIAGSDSVLIVPLGSSASMSNAFDTAYRARFGSERGAGELLIATLQVAATGREQSPPSEAPSARSGSGAARQTALWTNGAWRNVDVFQRDDLSSSSIITGPAIVVDDHGTTVIDLGWQGQLNEHGHLLLERLAATSERLPVAGDDSHPDPIRLEVFNRLFMNIAEQMGSVLQNTALSVNIRERLDFSCALFDGDGRLVSNAPHMPVHLGSMGESVRSVIAARGDNIKEGDAVMLNSPYSGGTHLPDITVVSPWFGGSDRPRFFVASRAHHADIGGITPGSMPAGSQHIDEEGVLLDNVTLVADGQFQEAQVRTLFGAGRWPARNVEQNLADLRAQLAANQQGMRQLDKTVARYGLATVLQYLRHVRDNAAASVRRLLDTLHDGAFDYELDSGEHICVSIKVDAKAGSALVDFTGSSAQSPSNFNAPQAVTRAAVLYVFRSLISDAIPMNEGCLEPLHIRIPEGSLLSPQFPAAVVAGNVETSQCVTDALYGALNALAASQGTMNNLSFGNSEYQYYETIAGGAGAGPHWHGASAVQTHMTNSRLTDTEVMEQTFPVRIERFAVRRGSGGKGRWHGGDGIVREIQFLSHAEVTVLSNHRRIAPFGIAGGESGTTGINTLLRIAGGSEQMPATTTVTVQPGDRICIETPGGGGFGPADGRKQS